MKCFLGGRPATLLAKTMEDQGVCATLFRMETTSDAQRFQCHQLVGVLVGDNHTLGIVLAANWDDGLVAVYPEGWASPSCPTCGRPLT